MQIRKRQCLSISNRFHSRARLSTLAQRGSCRRPPRAKIVARRNLALLSLMTLLRMLQWPSASARRVLVPVDAIADLLHAPFGRRALSRGLAAASLTRFA